MIEDAITANKNTTDTIIPIRLFSSMFVFIVILLFFSFIYFLFFYSSVLGYIYPPCVLGYIYPKSFIIKSTTGILVHSTKFKVL